MGLLIVCKGADFSACAVDKVEIPADPDCNHEYTNACDTTCNLCGATRTVAHSYVDGFCSVCGARDLENNPYEITEYPVKDGLKGLYDLGGTDSIVNRSNSGAEVGGTTSLHKPENIGIDENYCTFSGNANTSRLFHSRCAVPCQVWETCPC